MRFNLNHVFGGFNSDQILLLASVVVVMTSSGHVVGDGPVVTAIARHDQWSRSCHCRHCCWAFVARRAAGDEIVSSSALQKKV